MKDISILKTLYFNFYYLPFKSAMRMPFRVGKKVKIDNMGKRNSVKVENLQKHIGIGVGQSFGLGKNTFWSVADNASLIIRGGATIGRGTQIIVDGELILGCNFYCNADCIINAGKKVEFGNDALLGWNVTVIDGDGHAMLHSEQEMPRYEEIFIGNHVWLAANSSVLKGSLIGNDTVVAYGGIVSKRIEQPNVIIGGQNKVLRTNSNWRK